MKLVRLSILTALSALSLSAFAFEGNRLTEENAGCVAVDLSAQTADAAYCSQVQAGMQAESDFEEAAALFQLQALAGGRCSFDSQCGFNERCTGGRCVRKGGFGQCNSDFDCGFNERCTGSRCVRKGSPGECRSNIDCTGLEICVGGKCVRKNGFDNRCFSNFDCPTFYKCIDRKCVRP